MGVRKREAADARKEANKQIAFAKLNNCPSSPRKMRLVADQVRGQKVENALNILRFSPKEEFFLKLQLRSFSVIPTNCNYSRQTTHKSIIYTFLIY